MGPCDVTARTHQRTSCEDKDYEARMQGDGELGKKEVRHSMDRAA
jgi:hypothetical protein